MSTVQIMTWSCLQFLLVCFLINGVTPNRIPPGWPGWKPDPVLIHPTEQTTEIVVPTTVPQIAAVSTVTPHVTTVPVEISTSVVTTVKTVCETSTENEVWTYETPKVTRPRIIIVTTALPTYKAESTTEAGQAGGMVNGGFVSGVIVGIVLTLLLLLALIWWCIKTRRRVVVCTGNAVFQAGGFQEAYDLSEVAAAIADEDGDAGADELLHVRRVGYHSVFYGKPLKTA
jgi:hypothetical protein